jgi:hypothetical protein
MRAGPQACVTSDDVALSPAEAVVVSHSAPMTASVVVITFAPHLTLNPPDPFRVAISRASDFANALVAARRLLPQYGPIDLDLVPVASLAGVPVPPSPESSPEAPSVHIYAAVAKHGPTQGASSPPRMGVRIGTRFRDPEEAPRDFCPAPATTLYDLTMDVLSKRKKMRGMALELRAWPNSPSPLLAPIALTLPDGTPCSSDILLRSLACTSPPYNLYKIGPSSVIHTPEPGVLHVGRSSSLCLRWTRICPSKTRMAARLFLIPCSAASLCQPAWPWLGPLQPPLPLSHHPLLYPCLCPRPQPVCHSFIAPSLHRFNAPLLLLRCPAAMRSVGALLVHARPQPPLVSARQLASGPAVGTASSWLTPITLPGPCPTPSPSPCPLRSWASSCGVILPPCMNPPVSQWLSLPFLPRAKKVVLFSRTPSSFGTSRG